MLRTLPARIDLKNRPDIYGVLHLYSTGMRGKSVDFFNKVVRPFAPRMRYLVTEFNIRLSLDGNPHLTNKYAMEFALKLAGCDEPSRNRSFVHALRPCSLGSLLVKRQEVRDGRGRPRRQAHRRRDIAGLASDADGKGLRALLAARVEWRGALVSRRRQTKLLGGETRRIVVTLINDTGKAAQKKASIAGREMSLSAPPRSIVCFDQVGRAIDQLSMPY